MTTHPRPTLDETLMRMARVLAMRATCSRLSVGALVARDTRVISSGYNGVPSGLPHCQHTPNETSCTLAVHAEANAIAFAARAGCATEGATLYCTHSPCAQCSKLIINAGIERVVYATDYRDSSPARLLAAGVRVDQLVT